MSASCPNSPVSTSWKAYTSASSSARHARRRGRRSGQRSLMPRMLKVTRLSRPPSPSSTMATRLRLSVPGMRPLPRRDRRMAEAAARAPSNALSAGPLPASPSRPCTSWQAPLAGCDRAAAGTPPCDHAAAGWVSSASGAPRFRPRSPRAAGPGYALVLPRAVRCQTRPVVGAALAGIYAPRRWLQTPVADARLESPRHTSLQVRLPTSG
mmetsp:Transcript_29189/g.73164  ORF Transcript_29189/g.73164 Transcript_29189/m.73164 type:complete len:210 (+) Transcript_29189:335-964(+)